MTTTLAKSEKTKTRRWTLEEAMAALRKMGTAQNVKVYKRHGAGENLFGVSFANLTVLKKQLGVDHDLALALWDTGNSDARTLGTMIADPSALAPDATERWVNETRYYLLSDLLSGLVARSRFAREKMEEWMRSEREFVKQCGYDVLGGLLRDGAEITDSECSKILGRIEKEIHGSPNRARHAMNMALIGIGIYRPALEARAIAAARRIGKVEVDHGETGCKTPDAASYIPKARAYFAARAAKAGAGKAKPAAGKGPTTALKAAALAARPARKKAGAAK